MQHGLIVRGSEGGYVGVHLGRDVLCAGSEYCGENTARYCHGHTSSVTQYLHAPGPVLQYHPRGREVFAPPILGLRLRDIGILGQGPCAGSMQYCNKNTCFACLKYWNTAPQHLRYWDTGNTVKYSNSPCLLMASKNTLRGCCCRRLSRARPIRAHTYVRLARLGG